MTSDIIPLSVPYLTGNERRYLEECIDTNWVSSAGPFVEQFEGALAMRLGADFGVATTSGTAALHLSLLVAGVEPDDEILVSTLTFIASANAIKYVGAHPVFVDAEPDHGQFSVEKARQFIEEQCEARNGMLHNKVTRRRVRALMPVHILGHPVDMDPLVELAREFDLLIVEDATEALGSLYRDMPVGTHGDIAAFSFNGNKTITTGGGGMIVTDNGHWADRARYLSTQAKDDPVESIHAEVGFNYRLTNLQAAVGCAQMERLDDILRLKVRIAEKYDTGLREIPGVEAFAVAPWATPSFWLYTVKLDVNGHPATRKRLQELLAREGIQARPLWQPLHMSPAYKGAQSTDCTDAERLRDCSISLPSSAGLTTSEQKRVMVSLEKNLRLATTDR